jgi:hypothetical protein
MNLSTYRTAIKTWVEAQAAIPAQWRDAAGGWQSKAFALLHLQGSQGKGVDWLAWSQDTDLDPGEDLVPTVQGCRALTLSILVKSRNQDYTAMGYLEKLRASLVKPSVKAALRTAGLAFSTVEAVADLDGWYDDRTESVASLDVHFNAVENEEDVAEAGGFPEAVIYTTVTVTGVANSKWYRVTVNGVNFTYTSDTNATAAEIRAGLRALILAGGAPVVDCVDSGTALILTFTDGGGAVVAVSTEGGGSSLFLSYFDGITFEADPT